MLGKSHGLSGAAPVRKFGREALHFEVGYSTGTGENRIDTFPAEWLRRPELTDLDGIVPPALLERIRGHQEKA